MISPARAVAWTLVLFAASCARYEPSPLDPQSHGAEWAGRGADFPGVADFAQRLAETKGQAAEFKPADGLSLNEAEIVGLVFNGGLRAARARLGVARADAAYAGLWPDPEINLELVRLLGSASPAGWVDAADAVISIPLSGGPGFEQERADAAADAEAWRVAGEEWNYLLALRLRWIDWSAARMKIQAAREQMEATGGALATAQTLAAADEIRRADMRLFTVNKIALEAELEGHLSDDRLGELEIKALLGLRPDAGAALQPALDPYQGAAAADAAAQEAGLRERHPMLRVKLAEHEAAERKLHKEIRAAWPDIRTGPAYDREDLPGEAGRRIFSFTLPLWNRNRRAIAEARAAREAAKAAYESEAERLVGELAAERQRLEAAQAQRRILAESLAPLADEQLREARSLAELGDFDALLVLEALRSAHETKIKIIDAQAAIARAEAKILSLAPPADDPLALKELTHEDRE